MVDTVYNTSYNSIPKSNKCKHICKPKGGINRDLRQPIIELPLFVSRKEQTIDNSVHFPHMETVQ